jgi:hypothetical protein
VSKRAEFCKNTCPTCKKARAKGRANRWLVKHIDRKVCPMCRAYEREYQKLAYE